MSTIATHLSFLGTLQKCLGSALKEGLPEQFMQRIIDDPMLRRDFVAWAIHRLAEKEENPYKQTVEEQLNALRQQNELNTWHISEEVFDRLLKTAPQWPAGIHALRSLRVRFGSGRDGVMQTFEAHVAAINRVHKNFRRWKHIRSGKRQYGGRYVDGLRLLNGDYTHRPEIDWILIPDLQANRARESLSHVRGESSLADEGLVLVWLMPELFRAIDGETQFPWLLAGYELNVPEDGGDEWQRVPCVGSTYFNQLELDAVWSTDSDAHYTVPTLLKRA